MLRTRTRKWFGSGLTRFNCPAACHVPAYIFRALLRRDRTVCWLRKGYLQVEDALYSFCQGNMQEYTEKAKTLKFNIEKNKELRGDILSQAIRADDLVARKSAELAERAKKSMRETAKAESLQETINNDELKNLKDMAAGLSMRKTDAGLAVVDPDAEKAKKQQDEELERRKLEEERICEAAVAREKQQKALVKVDMGDENAYLASNWEYPPKLKDKGECGLFGWTMQWSKTHKR
jgi:hypothetical protein